MTKEEICIQNLELVVQQFRDTILAEEKARRYGLPKYWDHYWKEKRKLDMQLANLKEDKYQPVNQVRKEVA